MSKSHVIQQEQKVAHRYPLCYCRYQQSNKNLLLLFKKESSQVFPQNTKGVVSGYGYPICWIFYVPNRPNLVYFQYKPLWNMAFTMAYSMDSMDSSRHSKNDKFPCVLLLALVGYRIIWVG